VLIKTHNARIEDSGTPFIEDKLTAGAIYVVRNPLDVAVSFAAARRIGIDQAIADMADMKLSRASDARSVYMVCGSWSGNVKSWIDHGDSTTLTVRYEDMLNLPEATFGKIAEHMMTQPTADQLKRAISLATRKQSTRPPSSGHESAWGATVTRTRWQDVLSAGQVKRVARDHGRQMARFGYAP
jgi:hypothetical protein